MSVTAPAAAASLPAITLAEVERIRTSGALGAGGRLVEVGLELESHNNLFPIEGLSVGRSFVMFLHQRPDDGQLAKALFEASLHEPGHLGDTALGQLP